MITLERSLASRLRLLPQLLDVGLAGKTREKRPESLEPANVRRQFHFPILKHKIRRTIHGERERHVLAQFGSLVFLAMLGEKLLQVLDDGCMRLFQVLADLLTEWIVISRSDLGIVAGGVDRSHHGEQ